MVVLVKKRKKYDNCYYPSNIDNHVILRGPTGPMGQRGATGATGPAGGPTSLTGPTGATGTGGILNFADFYALMPPDNSATVAPGTDKS